MFVNSYDNGQGVDLEFSTMTDEQLLALRDTPIKIRYLHKVGEGSGRRAKLGIEAPPTVLLLTTRLQEKEGAKVVSTSLAAQAVRAARV